MGARHATAAGDRPVRGGRPSACASARWPRHWRIRARMGILRLRPRVARRTEFLPVGHGAPATICASRGLVGRRKDPARTLLAFCGLEWGCKAGLAIAAARVHPWPAPGAAEIFHATAPATCHSQMAQRRRLSPPGRPGNLPPRGSAHRPAAFPCRRFPPPLASIGRSRRPPCAGSYSPPRPYCQLRQAPRTLRRSAHRIWRAADRTSPRRKWRPCHSPPSRP